MCGVVLVALIHVNNLCGGESFGLIVWFPVRTSVQTSLAEKFKMAHRVQFLNLAASFFCTSRHFCYFKVRGSHACHGIYFVFHGNTLDTRDAWKFGFWHLDFDISKNKIVSRIKRFAKIIFAAFFHYFVVLP